MTKFLAIVLAASLISSQAAACWQPTVPSSTKPRVPEKPFCHYSRGCSDFEISNYNAEIDAFNRRAKAYVAEMNQFAREANEYAKCSVDELNTSIRYSN